METEPFGQLFDFYKYMPISGLEERLEELDQDVERMYSSLETANMVKAALKTEIERRRNESRIS